MRFFSAQIKGTSKGLSLDLFEETKQCQAKHILCEKDEKKCIVFLFFFVWGIVERTGGIGWQSKTCNLLNVFQHKSLCLWSAGSGEAVSADLLGLVETANGSLNSQTVICTIIALNTLFYDLICTPLPITGKHAVNGNPTVEPFPEGMETIMFGEITQSHFSVMRIKPTIFW